jgi:hypothetical protein
MCWLHAKSAADALIAFVGKGLIDRAGTNAACLDWPHPQFGSRNQLVVATAPHTFFVIRFARPQFQKWNRDVTGIRHRCARDRERVGAHADLAGRGQRRLIAH